MTDPTGTPQAVPTNYVKYIAGGLGIWLAIFYIALIFNIDNTNLGTANGLVANMRKMAATETRPNIRYEAAFIGCTNFDALFPPSRGRSR
jgi:hypothetical protein